MKKIVKKVTICFNHYTIVKIYEPKIMVKNQTAIS